MKSRMEQRLQTLTMERQKGQKALTELDSQRAQLTESILRIDGAMIVLRELLNDAPGEQRVELKEGVASTPEPLRKVSP